MTRQARGATMEPAASVLIAPGRGWASLNLREVWSYRELLYFFVWRDLKVRYKQTVIGALWAVIQPVGLMVVFSLFLGQVRGIGPANIPYPLFVLAGLVPWTLFSQGVGRASDSLVGASNLIQKVYFPRVLLPIAPLGSQLLDFVIGLAVLLIAVLAAGIAPTLAVVWAIPLTALTLLWTLAVGVWLAAANVRYRDVRHLVPFVIQLGLFASPVAYAAGIVPAEWLGFYDLNPMTGVIEGFRWALLGESDPHLVEAVLASLAVTVAVLAGGLTYFRRVERTFADEI